MHLVQDVAEWRNRQQNETSVSGKGENIFSPVNLYLLQASLKKIAYFHRIRMLYSRISAVECVVKNGCVISRRYLCLSIT
jgi:hypothetical protein